MKWSSPQSVTKPETVFGGDMEKLLPPFLEIPDEFKDHNAKDNKWLNLQRTWFFDGLPSAFSVTPKEGIDAQEAWNHLQAIQRSFQPKHEHKEAGVAYLASLWFEDYTLGETA